VSVKNKIKIKIIRKLVLGGKHLMSNICNLYVSIVNIVISIKSTIIMVI